MSVSLRVTLEDMPAEVRAWLLSKDVTRPVAAPGQQAQPPPAAAERTRTRSPWRLEATDGQARRAVPPTPGRRAGQEPSGKCNDPAEASSQVLQALGRLEEPW